MDLIANLAPTGMIPTREMTPHVPISVAEIVEDVHRAVEIGISTVHFHARDEVTGEPTYRTEVYERIIAGISNSQLRMNSVAIAAGGGVGLEDNVYSDAERTRLATNADLPRRIHTIGQANGRKLMTSRELRCLLNLERGHGRYGRRPKGVPSNDQESRGAIGSRGGDLERVRS